MIFQKKCLSIVLGYSTQAVMVVDVAIIGIEIGIVVEIVQPRGPPNVITLSAALSLQLHPTRGQVVAAVLIKLEQVQFEGFITKLP